MRPPLFETPQVRESFIRALNTRALGQRIDFHPRAQSTNSLALEAARAGAPHGTAVIADWQESGRGRRGRAWECVPGAGLLLSVLIRPEGIPVRDSGWIPLLTGLSCVEALEAVEPECAPALKWPNDIVIPARTAPGWRKLGGILCEAAIVANSSAPESRFVVLGIGLNLDQSAAELPTLPKAPPTSLRLETGREFDRETVLKTLLETLERNLLLAEKPEPFAHLKSAIEARLREWWSDGTCLSFRHTSQEQSPVLSAQFAGLDDFGCIRLRDENGERAYADIEIVGVDLPLAP